MRRFIVPFMFVFVLGCASSTPFIVTGETLDGAGQQFVSVGNAMNAGLATGKVTPTQYKKWAAFAPQFKALYPTLIKGWKDAVKVNDHVLAKDLAAVLSTLVGTVIEFSTLIKK